MVPEGSVKYHTEHTREAECTAPHWEKLNEARNQLFRLGLIGVNPEGIGFGNISIRSAGEEFLITGTGTGAIPELSPGEYCLVSSFDIPGNTLVSRGPIQASAESMTHGAVYRALPEVNCIIHIHSRKIFDGMVSDRYPATAAEAEYGTPEIALAAENLARSGSAASGVMVLLGHDGGVLAYGPSIERALALILVLHTRYNG